MYKVNIKENKEIDTIIIPLYSDSLIVKNVDLNQKLSRLIYRDKFSGKLGEVSGTEIEINREIVEVIFLGLDKSEEITKEKIRRAFGKVSKVLKTIKCTEVNVDLEEILWNKLIDTREVINTAIEGLVLGAYKFDKYINNYKDNKEEINLTFKGINNIEDFISEMKEVENTLEIIYKVRDLINEPSNKLYPETLAEEAIKDGKEYGYEVEVLDENEIEALKMEAFLSVGQGSHRKPKFIIMRYLGNKDSDNILGLVGKGLTYDSGGYSIKPSDSMVNMKADMGGAAVVIGVMNAIARNKLKKNVVAVIPACENVISEYSYKPGDIINSMAGKTIEVINVDAEGRLTLVDGITYIINKEKVNKVIDVATLTNTVMVALGKDVAAAITNNEEFYKELEEAIKVTDEKIWRLPNYEDYKKLFKSDIADLKNYGSSYGKAISAGMFIGEFTEKKPWIHLDIAGPSFIDEEMDYCIKGGTGFSVRTLYQLIKNSNQ